VHCGPVGGGDVAGLVVGWRQSQQELERLCRPTFI
jgi:hypothetical protein